MSSFDFSASPYPIEHRLMKHLECLRRISLGGTVIMTLSLPALGDIGNRKRMTGLPMKCSTAVNDLCSNFKLSTGYPPSTAGLAYSFRNDTTCISSVWYTASKHSTFGSIFYFFFFLSFFFSVPVVFVQFAKSGYLIFATVSAKHHEIGLSLPLFLSHSQNHPYICYQFCNSHATKTIAIAVGLNSRNLPRFVASFSPWFFFFFFLIHKLILTRPITFKILSL